MQLVIDAAGPEPDPERSQWFTPPEMARALVGLAGAALDDATRRGYPLCILEPSAGAGNLVRAALERCPTAAITAIELDPRWEPVLREAGAIRVWIDDYLAREAPPARYDLAITNPPYDGGEETEHLAKLLDETERIAALLPSRSLHGRERYDRVWHRFDPRHPKRDWWIRQKRHCIARPKFGASGGSDEIVLLDLRRVPGDCEMSWV